MGRDDVSLSRDRCWPRLRHPVPGAEIGSAPDRFGVHSRAANPRWWVACECGSVPCRTPTILALHQAQRARGPEGGFSITMRFSPRSRNASSATAKTLPRSGRPHQFPGHAPRSGASLPGCLTFNAPEYARDDCPVGSFRGALPKSWGGAAAFPAEEKNPRPAPGSGCVRRIVPFTPGSSRGNPPGL